MLTVSTASTTLAGNYPLTISAGSLGRTKTASATLVVPITVTISPFHSYNDQYITLSTTPINLTATVTGTTNTAVRWDLLPHNGYLGEGTLIRMGNAAIYTTPGHITYNSSVRIQATSLADVTKIAEWAATLDICSFCVSIARDTAHFPNDPQGALLPGQSVHLIATLQNGGTVMNWDAPPGTLSITGGSLTTTYTAPADMSGSSTVHILAHSLDSLYEIDLARVATDTPPSPPQSDFSISASPSSPGSNIVAPGGMATYTITTGGSGGSVDFSSTSSVTGLPQSANWTIYPRFVGTGGSATLTITTSGSTSASSYHVTITGTSGSYSHPATVQLVVQAAQPDFYLSISPASQGVGSTNIAGYAVRVIPVNGFTGAVSFNPNTVTGLPAGATANFIPPQVTSPGTTILTIMLPPNRQLGTSYFTVTGTSGGLAHAAPASLAINSIPPGMPAKVISPASGSTLTGTTASFKWDCGVRVSQYSLSVGSSPGVGDYYSTSACTSQTVNVSFPVGQPKVYATALSLIDAPTTTQPDRLSRPPAFHQRCRVQVRRHQFRRI